METVQMSKTKLIEILKENLKNHISHYNKALEGWEDDYATQMENEVERIGNGTWNGEAFLFTESKPKSYAESYEEMISQLEHDIRDTIELYSTDYRKYVLDKWEWKKQFAASTMKYLA